ncbi:MAG: hypothetical protein AMJ84_06865 [Acidithiobacillales bacterium SM23_46]|nr:MAG: hypothetical protein AMJ84_06865 [Acidithiobacillales bacterium SM23_46]
MQELQLDLRRHRLRVTGAQRQAQFLRRRIQRYGAGEALTGGSLIARQHTVNLLAAVVVVVLHDTVVALDGKRQRHEPADHRRQRKGNEQPHEWLAVPAFRAIGPVVHGVSLPDRGSARLPQP